MDYQDARRIRKSGLLSLIAEGYFEANKGLGGSIGGAISDKFKARAVGFKESIDPLNFVRKLTGEGLLGDVAVTGFGRLVGRKDKDIAAFGGYKRKNKKDSRYASIGSGPIRPLRMGDSESDILGKMYNFMVKTSEVERLEHEIENAFKQEQLDEDNRRHNELVKAIKSFTKGRGGNKTEEVSSGLGIGLPEVIAGAGAADIARRALGGSGRLLKSVASKFSRNPMVVPKVSEPEVNIPKEKIGSRGTRTPVARGSSEAKGNLKANRASRSVPMREPAKSLTRTEKAIEAVKPAAKTAIKVSKTAIRGARGLLRFLASVPGLNTMLAGGVAYLQIQEAIDAHERGEITEKEMHQTIVGSVGGAIGAVAGGTIGATVGLAVGGPVGAILGGIAGGVYVGAKGQDAAEGLYKFFTTSSEKTIEEQQEAISKLSKLRQTNAGAMHGLHNPKSEATTKTVEPEFVGDIKDFAKNYKEQLKSSAGKGRGYSPNTQPVPTSRNIPVLNTSETSSGQQSSPQVAVNNTTNTIGGSDPKVINTASTPVRNRDVDRYLKVQSVAV
jgi:hypothetical protein